MTFTKGLLWKIAFICLYRSCMGYNPEKPPRLFSFDYNPNSQLTIDNESSSTTDISLEGNTNIDNHKPYQTVNHVTPIAHNSSRTGNSEKQNDDTQNLTNSVRRKARDPVSESETSLKTTSSQFNRPTGLLTTAMNYGTGEPTTTIVYATSIPISKTYPINIRSSPFLPAPKYRSTILESTQENKRTDTIKPTTEEAQPRDPVFRGRHSNVPEKPIFRLGSSPGQVTMTPQSHETTPYSIGEPKRNLVKSIPYARIRTKDDISEKSSYNGNLENSYPKDNWMNEDYKQRKIPPTSTYMDQTFPRQNTNNNFYQLRPDKNIFPPQYNSNDNYSGPLRNQIPTPSSMYVPQAPTFPYSLQQSRHNFQPLTIRDFDLLLQLLVLRERRLRAYQDSYSYQNDGIRSQDSNYYYEKPKQTGTENLYFKTLEPKYLEHLTPKFSQLSSDRLLPPNIREELLFHLLLLALNMQPQMITARSPAVLPPPYMLINPSPSPYLGLSAGERMAPNNPVRSIQILGESD